MTDSPPIQLVERQSVQDLPDAKRGDHGALLWASTQRGYLLPAWGTRERERALRLYYRHEYNWLGQSAIAGLVKKVKSAKWELSSKRNAAYFQGVLRDAGFGAGWGDTLARGILDYCRQDGGAYFEVIGPGNPTRALTGKVTGLAHLDSYRVYPTGDPEHPAIYYSRKGEMHLMHKSRIMHLVDMPDGDESSPGYGLCALSRAISIVGQQMHMNRYVETKLDDQPPPGFVIASGITEGQRNQALGLYTAEQSGDARPLWGKTAWFYSLAPEHQIKLDYVTFSQAPESWSYKEYTELHVNAWAAALGVDVQEIWQLTSGSLGSGAQSEVLHAKSQGRTFGDLLTALERGINDLLPDYQEFTFKARDPYAEKEEAAVAQSWAGFVSSLGTIATDDEKRRMMADKVETFKDAVTDEKGEIVRLSDTDDAADEQTVDDTAAQNSSEGTSEEQIVDDAKAVKAIQSTRLDFENDFEDLLTQARDKDISRRAFGIQLRGMIARYGEQAYLDGLAAGGVDTMDTADNARYALLLVEQSKYVSGLGEALYTTGVSDTQATLKPAMWFNKSLMPFYDAGVLSADRNGMYEFTGIDGVESCRTCRKLKNQQHRFKWWVEKRLRPRVDTENFECGGWQCQHQLVRVVK